MRIEVLDADAGIFALRLDRAPVNALDPALCNALREAVRQAVGDGARGLVLASAHRPDGPAVFSAGLDVPHLLSLGDDRERLRAAWTAFFDAARALASCPVPVAAAINGHAPAGGCVLALCCDYRIMADSPDPTRPLRIGLNETQVGLAVPEGVQHLLQRVVGVNRAERLLVAGEMVDTAQAQRIGLVDEVVPMDRVVPRAHEWLASLLALPQDAMRRTREIARADVGAAMQPARIALDEFLDAWYAPGTQQALQALVARLRR
ncbi:enoyl-CoA hydratase/isomerase family protein [Cognatilysobacter bugurensis]|uniref:enoyl-CoA hydratase/isomerase family protein n=1 Tax=Cognatilysobacter bugurensis TaxID=543356 RepID=UPI001678D8E7|nr:enoyl-CoA hydratase/isomerase family protein [Lysobacter bugurensis]